MLLHSQHAPCAALRAWSLPQWLFNVHLSYGTFQNQHPPLSSLLTHKNAGNSFFGRFVTAGFHQKKCYCKNSIFTTCLWLTILLLSVSTRSVNWRH